VEIFFLTSLFSHYRIKNNVFFLFFFLFFPYICYLLRLSQFLFLSLDGSPNSTADDSDEDSQNKCNVNAHSSEKKKKSLFVIRHDAIGAG